MRRTRGRRSAVWQRKKATFLVSRPALGRPYVRARVIYRTPRRSLGRPITQWPLAARRRQRRWGRAASVSSEAAGPPNKTRISPPLPPSLRALSAPPQGLQVFSLKRSGKPPHLHLLCPTSQKKRLLKVRLATKGQNK